MTYTSHTILKPFKNEKTNKNIGNIFLNIYIVININQDIIYYITLVRDFFGSSR